MDDMNKKINNQSVQNVMNTARQVFGAEDCKKLNAFCRMRMRLRTLRLN